MRTSSGMPSLTSADGSGTDGSSATRTPSVQWSSEHQVHELPPRSAVLRYSRLLTSKKKDGASSASAAEPKKSAFQSGAQPAKPALKPPPAQATSPDAHAVVSVWAPPPLPEELFPRMAESPTHAVRSEFPRLTYSPTRTARGGGSGSTASSARSSTNGGTSRLDATQQPSMQPPCMQDAARPRQPDKRAPTEAAAGVAVAGAAGGVAASAAAAKATAAGTVSAGKEAQRFDEGSVQLGSKDIVGHELQQPDGSTSRDQGRGGSSCAGSDGSAGLAAVPAAAAMGAADSAAADIAQHNAPAEQLQAPGEQLQEPEEQPGMLRYRYEEHISGSSGGSAHTTHAAPAAGAAALVVTWAFGEGEQQEGGSSKEWCVPQADGGAALGGSDGGGSGSPQVLPPGDTRPLPPLMQQLTLRALLAGLVVGAALALLCQRLALVAGVVAAPAAFQLVAAGGCWLLLRALRLLLGRDCGGWMPPVRAQETAVAAAAALACAGSVAAGGYASALTALSSEVAAQVGTLGANSLDAVFPPDEYWRHLAWMLLVTLGGGMLAAAWHKPLMADRHTTFPTGDAAGSLIAALHVPPGSYHGRNQRKKFSFWAVMSGCVAAYTWVFSHPACLGLQQFPLFGVEAARWTWSFDFQSQYVGAGFIVTGPVAYSVMVGALAAWALLFPLLNLRAGEWYPADLPLGDIRGLYGYQLCCALALLAAHALYTAGKLPLEAARPHLANAHWCSCLQWCSGGADYERHTADGSSGQSDDDGGDDVEGGQQRKGGDGKDCGGAAAAQQARTHSDSVVRQLEREIASDCSSLQFSLATVERALRRQVFLADAFHGGWLGVTAFALLAVAAAAGLPALVGLGVQWYIVAVAALVAAVAALGTSSAAGLTDWNPAACFGQLALVLFAAWGGGDQGTANGLVAAALVNGVAWGAAQALYALRAGYVVFASPLALLAAQFVGALAGCFIAPALLLVVQPSGSAAAAALPAPLTVGWRAAAALAADQGLAILPVNCLWFALAAAAVGLGLSALRDAVPSRWCWLVPLPAAVAVPFLSGASLAVGLMAGTLARLVWCWRYPRSCDAYAAVVGGALVAGNGVWALARGIMAAFGVQPPLCMTFTTGVAAA